MNIRSPAPARQRPRNGALIKTFFRKRYGFTDDALASIGTLFLAWSLFENEAELAIWKLTAPPKAGERPATDGMQSRDLIRALVKSIRSRTSDKETPAIAAFQGAAEDVLAYRNAIAHGRPRGGLIGQHSTSNSSSRGEIRKRATETAHLDPALLNMMLEALETLYIAVYKLVHTANVDEGLRLMLGDKGLHSAQSAASEARNIAFLVNHEKY